MYVIFGFLARPFFRIFAADQVLESPMSVPASRIASQLLPIVAATLVLAACGQQNAGGGFPGFPPGEVTTVTVTPRNLPVTYEYVGQTAGSKEVEVRARVTGILERKLYQEGAPVRAGQVLFVI